VHDPASYKTLERPAPARGPAQKIQWSAHSPCTAAAAKERAGLTEHPVMGTAARCATL
jgi:hypothetical protein